MPESFTEGKASSVSNRPAPPENTSKARILLADDHVLVAEGLRKLLEVEYELVGVVQDGREVVLCAARMQPELVLLDITMPLLNGIEAAQQMQREVPSAKVVFLTQQTDRHVVQAAFHAGAAGYVLKQSASAELLAAIREVLQGRYYVTPFLLVGIPEGLFQPHQNPAELFGTALTSRQREVLQLVAGGKSAKEIALALHISARTVEFHKAGIMDELGLRTTAELTRYAIETGLV